MDGAVEFLVAQLAKRVREAQVQSTALQGPPSRGGPVPAGARRVPGEARPVAAVPAPPAIPAPKPTPVPAAVEPLVSELLEAFGSRRALLGAIVLSEALAPPLGLRSRDPGLGA
jgi:hypothetical protein